ncbi:NAD(P)H-dependent flavin oxidoreductase [Pelagibaculum spongiae]|uniref:Enoyl-ACP reductase n=1 Tax=Pelagibaculum spongiae TaxID=2080658 RepID=A0A2V1H1L6_9GAMM|nr:nitronate monooxygenase [Pelagibaculum spongiae]PVZ70271.1 enoyl-ACP reductase [Pelagibaculum spongiae]
MKTRITDLLGIEKPLILPGMSWVSIPELVAAVSNAGGLGILATGPLNEKETRAAIQKIRQLTDKPFGVGCTLLMPGAKENAKVALAEKVPVINFSLGKGDWICKQAHAYGGKVIATVVNEKHALSAQSIGADALMVTGHEAAAHGGNATSMVLLPAIADAVDIPLILAGGVADGRGLAATLALGGHAAAMGTRLATSQESPVHAATKQLILEKSILETIYSKDFDGLWCRVMETPSAKSACKKKMNFFKACRGALKARKEISIPLWKIVAAMAVAPTKVKDLAYFGAASQAIRASIEDGDHEMGVQLIGQSQGLVNDIASVDEIISRTVNQAEQVLGNLQPETVLDKVS